jgi:hypothetical protein
MINWSISLKPIQTGEDAPSQNVAMEAALVA